LLFDNRDGGELKLSDFQNELFQYLSNKWPDFKEKLYDFFRDDVDEMDKLNLLNTREERYDILRNDL